MSRSVACDTNWNVYWNELEHLLEHVSRFGAGPGAGVCAPFYCVDAHEIYAGVGFVPSPVPQNLMTLGTEGQRPTCVVG